jgi:hypothetical protein
MGNNKIVKTPVQRVLEKTVFLPWSGCWIFTGAVNKGGYGIVGLGKRGESNDRAHRITYRHFKGETPSGMFVCHTCDVRCCVNPDHLFLGTNQNNVDDMVKKKRNSKPPRNLHVVGEKHPLSKFSDQQVLQLREMHKSGSSIYKLAKDYKVANSTMQRIIQGKRYKNV